MKIQISCKLVLVFVLFSSFVHRLFCTVPSLLTVTCPKTEFSRDKCLMLPEHRIFGTKVGGAENIFTALVYEVKNVRKLLEQ